MMNIRSFLESLGLENHEPTVYIAALPLGTVAASSIATKLKMPRSSVRYTCEQLVSKGLMTVTLRANTKLFTAENPTKLYALVHAEQERIERKMSQLSDAVKEFQKIYNPKTSLPKVTFFDGVEGIGRLFEEMTETPTDIVSFGAGDYFFDRIPDIVTDFRKNAETKYKNIKILRAEKYQTKHTHEHFKNRQTRYFRMLDELKVDIQIADDKMSIASIANEAPVGVLIKHRDIVEAFRQIFDEVWDTAKNGEIKNL